MELPFAVASPDTPEQESQLDQSDSSLVTASSQGSFIDSSMIDTGPLLPDTPQDVILPRYNDKANVNVNVNVNANVNRPQPRISATISDEPDFTYVNVSEDDADNVQMMLDGDDLDLQPETQRGDILTVLLGGMEGQRNDELLDRLESANLAATEATNAKKKGDLIAALEYHSKSAKLYRDNALVMKDQNESLANSLLLLSQTQAKSALSLKGIVKLSAVELKQIFPSATLSTEKEIQAMTQKDRLRAAVRGALGSHPHEADISDSQFLGRASTDNNLMSPSNAKVSSSASEHTTNRDDNVTLLSEGQDSNHNAVDEMMELERELRDMDMALELGNSISSLDVRAQNRMKASVIDGSFMVVPPGSESYMSSSMWGNNPAPRAPRPVSHQNTNRTKNKVQTIQPTLRQTTSLQQVVAPQPSKNTNGLESSWWGNASTASQVLTSSVVSLGNPSGSQSDTHGGHPANTKQLMRLMDSLKTLGDENATLLREVEDAEAARTEAKVAREEMKRFKHEYKIRLDKLKGALKKYAEQYPNEDNAKSDHPVSNSDFHKNMASADQLQRQEQLIRKLTADLKKEKEALKIEKSESKKKDQALRKYENFYREVKARSAQKAAQKTYQNRQNVRRKLEK